MVSAFQPEPWKSRQMLFDAHKSLYEFYDIWNDNKNAIMLEEGKMCFAALRSVNSQRCKLNCKEKTEFLKKMSESKQMEKISQDVAVSYLYIWNYRNSDYADCRLYIYIYIDRDEIIQRIHLALEINWDRNYKEKL